MYEISVIYDKNNKHVAVELKNGDKVEVVPVNKLNLPIKGVSRCYDGTLRFPASIPRVEVNTVHYSLYTGKALESYVKNNLNSGYRCRNIVKDITAYLNSNEKRIFGVHGLRGTGKTIAMLQAIADDNDYDETVLIILNKPGITVTKIIEVLSILENKRKVFIDEISFATNFVTDSAWLADNLSCTGVRVVLSGTDSLVMSLAIKHALYHRLILKATTFTGYSEANYVQGVDFDTYLATGGMFEPTRIKDMDGLVHYVDTAILNNIVNTFKRNHGVSDWGDVCALSGRELRTLLFRTMYMIIFKNIGGLGTKDTRLSWYINRYEYDMEFKELQDNVLSQLDIEEHIVVSEDTIRQLLTILINMGIIIAIPNYAKMSDINYYFTNSAITIQLSRVVVKAIEQNNVSRKAGYNLKSVRGLVFESVVMVHLHKKHSDKQLYFYRDKNDVEVDIVVADENSFDEENKYWLYETKYTDDVDTAVVKTRWLNDTKIHDVFQCVQTKQIVYRGKTGVFNGFTSPVYTNGEDMNCIEVKNKGMQLTNVIEIIC